MDIQITFQDGPIEAEIKASEHEDYTEVLDQLAEFVDDYDAMGPIQPLENIESDPTKAKTRERSTENSTTETTESNSNSFFDEVDATDSELHRVLKFGTVEDGEVKEFPEIIADPALIGNSKPERLLNGAIIILSVLDDVHGISRVKTIELKDALSRSGLPEDSWSSIRTIEAENVYLNRRGKGSSATTEIREPGKEDAYEFIESLVEELSTNGKSEEQTTLN